MRLGVLTLSLCIGIVVLPPAHVANAAHEAKFLDIEPETDTNPNGTPHTLTASFTDEFGDPIQLAQGRLVDFEIISGPNANQVPGFRDFECSGTSPTQGGTCTATYTDAAPYNAADATDTICAWISTDGDDDEYNPAGIPADGGDCDAEVPNETEAGTDPSGNAIAGDEGNDQTDTVLKTWTEPQQAPATQVNAEPETATNPAGTQHVLGVFAGNANNQPTTGTPIRADILPGSPNASQQSAQAEIDCVADTTPGPGVTFPQGQSQTHECAYTGAGGDGTDNIRVFADSNNNGAFDQGEPFDDVSKTWSGAPFAVDLSAGDSARAGTCNEFTVRITDQQGNPVVSQVIDVEQVLQGAGTEPGETRELAFCNPTAGPNPTGQAGTAYGDVQGNNPGQTADQTGRNTTVHAEVGPTSSQGEVTFGITINHTSGGENATVNVRAWVDQGGDNDRFDAGEPTDTSTKTWLSGTSHGRLISLRFEHAPRGVLVVSGRLTVTDGFNLCRSDQAVSVQRRIGDRWVTRATTRSNGRGRYAVEMPDRKGKYRAVAARSEVFDLSTEEVHDCARASKVRRHTH